MKRLLTLLLGLLLALSLAGCGTSRPQTSASTGPAEGTLEVHFIDVGQADAALLLCGGETMLIDGGNVDDSDLIVSYLSGRGWRGWTMWCAHTPMRTMWAGWRGAGRLPRRGRYTAP